MSDPDDRLKGIHDLICRVDEQRKQFATIAGKLERLHEEIGQEMAHGPLWRDAVDRVQRAVTPVDISSASPVDPPKRRKR